MVVQWTRGILSLETSSELLGFVLATVSKTLEVKDKIFPLQHMFYQPDQPSNARVVSMGI